MKTIKIKSLSISNFKGIKILNLDFEQQTSIFGANGTGKTTIFDAFTWLLFGKESTDRKDFSIKNTKDKSLNRQDHTVEAIIEIDGQCLNLKRVFKENWVKKRGSLEAEFSGNVTEFYWDEVPVTQTEFNKKVSEIIPEELFKMITSTTYFNSIEWRKRRNILTEMFGDISNEELAAGNEAYERLIANLTNGKTLEDYKLQVSNSVKKAKEDLKLIPARIDEVLKGKPESQDFEALENELQGFQNQLKSVEESLSDANKAFQSKLDSQKDLKIQINNLEAEIKSIENNARREADERSKPDTSVLDNLIRKRDEKQRELSQYQNALNTLNTQKSNKEAEVKRIEEKISAKRTEWQTENERNINFDSVQTCCPTCKRDFDTSDVDSKKDELISNFNQDKQKKLAEINESGKSLSGEKEAHLKEIEALDTRIENGKKEVERVGNELKQVNEEVEHHNADSTSETQSPEVIYQSILSLNSEYAEKQKQVVELKGKIEEIPAVDNNELVSEKSRINQAIDSIKSKLLLKSQIEQSDNRVAELQHQEKTLAQQVADAEKIHFTIENFIKDKIDRLEQKINGQFKLVTFKMFEEQINGGYRETCEAMIDGVPFSDANTASKINAGIDIINTLCKSYDVSAPVFVDNAESVHTIIDSESQLIRLVVSEMHKKLTLESKELVA